MDQYCETKFICTHKFSNSFVSGAKFGLTLWRDLVVSLHQKVHSHTRSISSAKDLQYWWSFALLSIYLSLPFSFFWLPLLVCSPSASATYLPTYLWPPSFSYILIYFSRNQLTKIPPLFGFPVLPTNLDTRIVLNRPDLLWKWWIDFVYNSSRSLLTFLCLPKTVVSLGTNCSNKIADVWIWTSDLW